MRWGSPISSFPSTPQQPFWGLRETLGLRAHCQWLWGPVVLDSKPDSSPDK